MTLKRQLLLLSLLALMLPWAGCEFIRETESALRTVQQNMLAGSARALALSMAQYTEQYPDPIADGLPAEQFYLHPLAKAPSIDGYIDDWLLDNAALKSIRGTDGPIRIAMASYGQMIYLYVDVSDRTLVYNGAQLAVAKDQQCFCDRVTLISSSPPYLDEKFIFAAEAPGAILSLKEHARGFAPEPAITAHWQDVPGGYRIEAKIPASLLGTHLGIVVSNTGKATETAALIASYSGRTPVPTVRPSEKLRMAASKLMQADMRFIITDASGWRIAAGGVFSGVASDTTFGKGWSMRIYDMLIKNDKAARTAEPDPTGRERQPYVSAALNGQEMAGWFRAKDSGRAIVAVAAPIRDNDKLLGVLVLQQSTDAILSLTNKGLAKLITLTIVAASLVGAALAGYALWLSRRIRHLSIAAGLALENDTLHAALPSALSEDEIGDLSRSFSSVLQQLGDYNRYLRTLASKLSHELRTPLAIVSSSLENLEHEPLNTPSAGYTARAREGVDRLRRILSAMSEASRVEELMQHIDAEVFDLRGVLQATVEAYRDVYRNRIFTFDCSLRAATTSGAPELLVQMLDKLIDNAVAFSADGDTINIGLARREGRYVLTVMNPGVALTESMRTRMFDSMASMRSGKNSRNLGLGLYVAKLITEGHGGHISAHNVEGGVTLEVRLPDQSPR